MSGRSLAARLDTPLDPGNAYVSTDGGGRFNYAVICRGRKLFTNSKARFKRHYRAARRRGLSGTWFKRRDGELVWWRIRLSDHAL